MTDPEPLPDGHPLWTAPNCIVTPHVADTEDMVVPLFAERVARNVQAFGSGGGVRGTDRPGGGVLTGAVVPEAASDWDSVRPFARVSLLNKRSSIAQLAEQSAVNR